MLTNVFRSMCGIPHGAAFRISRINEEACNGVERELNNVTEKFRRFQERGSAEFAQTIVRTLEAPAELV